MGANFKRGLKQDFVNQLNEWYDSGKWWKAFVDDKDLFLAIRKDKLNVYYRGASLLLLEWHNGTVTGKIHYKYLLQPRTFGSDSAYVEIEPDSGRPCLSEEKDLFIEDLTKLKDLKAAAGLYAGSEKTGVYTIIAKHECILDTEVGFSTPRRYVDFAALKEKDQHVQVVFYEVKQFTDSRIRKEGDSDPEVISQIEEYHCLLKENRYEILDSYRKVCLNLRDLKGLKEKYPERHGIVKRVANGAKLSIDTMPKLVVFGYDRDQQKSWKEKYRKRLEEGPGDCQVISAGRPENIRLT